MKNSIIVLVFLALGMSVGLILENDPGYALLSYRSFAYEMPLWFLLLTLLVGFFILYIAVGFLISSISLPAKLKGWWAHRKIHKARAKTIQGLIELTEGNWKKAEDLLTHSVTTDTSLLNYLGAARAAQEQGAFERRDGYLSSAHQTNDKADVAISLTQAKLQLLQGQLEQSLATLSRLKETAPKHVTVLKLLQRLYLALNDWQSLRDLLPQLRKQKVLPEVELVQLETRVYESLLKDNDNKHVAELWRTAPKSVRENITLLLAYVRRLIDSGEHKEAELLIRDQLKTHWDDDLVYEYGSIVGADAKTQLATVETWLQSYSQNAVLLLTAARLSLRNHLWGKAKAYYEACIGFKPMPEAYQELGLLLESLGEADECNACFREGMKATQNASLELPMPKSKEILGDVDDKRLLILGA